jgi:hypothetical protein
MPWSRRRRSTRSANLGNGEKTRGAGAARGVRAAKIMIHLSSGGRWLSWRGGAGGIAAEEERLAAVVGGPPAMVLSTSIDVVLISLSRTIIVCNMMRIGF